MQNHSTTTKQANAALAQMRADRTPPFTTREVVVRLLATTYPAHALEPAIRRAAARDKHLEWRPGTGGYGYRHITPPPPASARSEAQERDATTPQPDRTAGPLDSAPAPRERPDGIEPSPSSTRPAR